MNKLLFFFVLMPFMAFGQDYSYPSIYFQKYSTKYATLKGTVDSNFFANEGNTTVPDTIRVLQFFLGQFKDYRPVTKMDSGYCVVITWYSNKYECKDTTLEYKRAKKVYDYLVNNGVNHRFLRIRCIHSNRGIWPAHLSKETIEEDEKLNLRQVRMGWIHLG